MNNENEKETKLCKHCQTEIPKKAKVCPNCRKKQGGIVKWIVIVIVAIFLLGVIFGGDTEESQKDTANDAVKAETQQDTSNAEENEKEEPEIEYTVCTVSEMMELLDTNAMKAQSTYMDQYVEITGRLSTIDSDGKYISLLPLDDDWAITGVHCYIQNDEQREKIMEMSTDDTVTLRGKITNVGEVLGYSLDIDSID